MSIVLAASLLSADFSCLGEQISALEQGGANWLHMDVMDGHFVPNLTIGPFVVEACGRVTKLPLDVHLMIEKPEQHLEAFASAGASTLTVHVETCPHLHRTLGQIKSLGCRAGVTLNPGTPVSAIEPVLHLADLVLVLSVNPGFSGQEFLPETIGKVTSIRMKLDAMGSKADLEVDGGMSAETLPLMRKAGANVFVSGVAVFEHPGGIDAGIKALRDSIGQKGRREASSSSARR